MKFENNSLTAARMPFTANQAFKANLEQAHFDKIFARSGEPLETIAGTGTVPAACFCRRRLCWRYAPPGSLIEV